MCCTPRRYVLLIQLSLWVSCAALSLNLPQSSSLNQTEPLKSDPICISNQALTVRHPVQSDCEAAINELPSISWRATFHIGPPFDVFKLPVTKASGTCWLRVNFVYHATEAEASWPELRAKAGQLNRICIASTSGLSRRKWGAIYTGEKDRILISLLDVI